MATRATAIADRRAPLNKERVLRAAIGLADEDGIESLSMRRLAHELGVEAMSLYYYVTNKEDLQGGMVDIVVGEFELASGGADWKAAIRRSAISAHDVLKRHPWACSLMMSPSGVRPARLRYMESLLERLRGAGFTAEMTHHAYHALDSHIIGSTLWQAGYSGMKLPAKAESSFLRELPNNYPFLDEHMQQHVTKPARKVVREFEFGLDLILDGLEQIRSSTRRPVARKRRAKSA
jgi:AcrR family transcriptional regulator